MTVYATSGGKFPMNASGQPTFVSEADFANCCCDGIDCQMSVYVKICLTAGIFSDLAGDTVTCTRPSVYDGYYASGSFIYSGTDLARVYVHKDGTDGWVVILQISTVSSTGCGGDAYGFTGASLAFNTSPANNGECPTLDVEYNDQTVCDTSLCESADASCAANSDAYVFLSATSAGASGHTCTLPFWTSVSESGDSDDTPSTADFDHTYTVANGDFRTGIDGIDIDIDWDMSISIADRIIVTPDVGTAYDSGCHVNTGSGTVTLSSLVTEVRVQVIGDCNSTGDRTVWSFTIDKA